MKKFLILSLFASLALAKIEGLEKPEGLIGYEGNLYLSNKAFDDDKAKNHSFISLFDSEGKLKELKFIDGLNSPNGLAVVSGMLYVCDQDELKGFDLKSKEQVFSIKSADFAFLNDIAVLDKENIFISDTAKGKIFKVNLPSKKYEIFATIPENLGGPNGLIIANNKLYSVGYDPKGKYKGGVFALDLNTAKLEIIASELGGLDGIALAKNGDLLVSDWVDAKNGVIYRIDKAGKITKLDLPAMAGPADIYSDGKKLWIPKMLESDMSSIDLP